MKKQIMRLVLAGLSALSLLIIPTLAQVGAQTGQDAANGFRISPVRAEYVIDKGKSETLTISLENPSEGKLIARPVHNNFIASEGESGEPRLILDDDTPPPKNDFKTLVKPIEDINLGPREKKDIQVKITIPENANSGGYYGAVRFIPILPDSGQQNVGLTASVGTIVLIRVPGPLTERLDLVQLSASQNGEARGFMTKGNVDLLVRLKNSGDIHLKPFGKIRVKNMFGKVVHEYEFNNTEPRANILPESTRRFIDGMPQQKWLGRYTIEANLGYAQGSGELITARASFWYIPAPILYAIIVGIIALVAAGYWLVRKQKAKGQHKHDVNKKR